MVATTRDGATRLRAAPWFCLARRRAAWNPIAKIVAERERPPVKCPRAGRPLPRQAGDATARHPVRDAARRADPAHGAAAEGGLHRGVRGLPRRLSAPSPARGPRAALPAVHRFVHVGLLCVDTVRAQGASQPKTAVPGPGSRAAVRHGGVPGVPQAAAALPERAAALSARRRVLVDWVHVLWGIARAEFKKQPRTVLLGACSGSCVTGMIVAVVGGYSGASVHCGKTNWLLLVTTA